MKKKNLLLIACLLSFFTYNKVFSQESDFDLSAQRSESQDILKVPGHKIENQDIIINPTPHNIIIDKNQKLDINQGLTVKGRQNEFLDDLSFILSTPGGKELHIDYGTSLASKNKIKPISGAYSLTVNKKGISIIGYDSRGAFYGIQTLKQLLNSPISKNGSLPYLEINDYPDLPLRGVVEGFYGTPWSQEVRLSLIDFYGKYKMNTYLYGPKDDPYHSSPNWRLPYPEKEANDIKELVKAANRNKVDFVWAVHPGKDIKWTEEDYNNLLHKFDLMYDLGVRSFAIFFDDIEGEGTNPQKQTELLNRLNKDFVNAKKDVTPIIFCPTDYSKLWANPTPEGSLSIFGNTLDPSILIFWTGDVVCSDLTRETMDWVNSRIKRPAFYWWNYPVTDYIKNIVLQGPAYGLDPTLSSNDLSGLVSNPMEHGEASKLALYGVADYSWNIADYNPLGNWERAFDVVAPEVKDAYRTFAIHSSDTENGYRRDESWETETFRRDNYTKDQYDALLQEFSKIEKAPSVMENSCKNKQLIAELRPWLEEFRKLGIRGQKTLELMEMYDNATPEKFWSLYVQNVMSKEDKDAYQAHKSGTLKLQPFYENGMNDMLYDFYSKVAGDIPGTKKAIGTYSNLYSPQGKIMFDNDTTTHYTSGKAQRSGDWIGVDLGKIKDVYEVSILQGRNSINDTDFFDHAILEYSTDGKDWIAMTDSLTNQYIINWKETPVQARYVRLKRLDSKKSNWSSIRSFDINPTNIESLGLNVKGNNLDEAIYAFDEDPTTSYHLNNLLSFDVPNSTSEYIILQKRSTPIKIKQYSSKGKLISESSSENDFLRIEPNKETKRIELEGDSEIFEIIQMKKK